MKICAIISEYNPLHYGHMKHIEESKEKTGADAIMCIMAGNFAQRGEPTIVNKYARAKMALEAGADIVVQIPTPYSCSSAEIFALAGVKIANSFDNVTHLSFGCETSNIELLKKIAEFLAKEPKVYKDLLKKYLEEGHSYASCRQKAMCELAKNGNISFGSDKEIEEILNQPNNILAIEYIKALIKTNSKIEPVFTLRKNSDYLSDLVNGKDTSAKAIRNHLYTTKSIRKIKKLVPRSSYEIIKEELNHFGLPDLTLYNDLCTFVLNIKSKDEIKNTYDVSEGLENKFKESIKKLKDLNEVLLDVKSKRYSYTRLKRIVLRLLLNIDSETVKKIYEIDKLPFIKVLAFKSNRKDLLSGINANTNLVIRNSNIEKNPSEFYEKLSLIEDNANAIYNLLLKKSKTIKNYAPDLLTKTIIE